MYRMKLHIRLTLMLVIILVSLSCSNDIVLAELQHNNEVEIGVGFRVPNTVALKEGYELGSQLENYIDIPRKDYRVYFFDTNNVLIAEFTPAQLIKTDQANYTDYQLLGKAPQELRGYTDFKILVLANWNSNDFYFDDFSIEEGTTTIDDICKAQWAKFKAFSGFLDIEDDRLIPFYGVHLYQGVKLIPGEVVRLAEPITLLRAMAKVELVVNTEDDIYITDARVVGHNQAGYCAPANVYDQSDYGQGDNWETDYLPSIHLINGANDTNATSNELVFVRQNAKSEDKDEKWVVYLPEYDNIGANEHFAYIEVKFNFQADDENPHKIYFSNYNNGTTDNTDRLNIERNNLYRFNLSISPMLFDVSVTVWKFGANVHIEV